MDAKITSYRKFAKLQYVYYVDIEQRNCKAHSWGDMKMNLNALINPVVKFVPRRVRFFLINSYYDIVDLFQKKAKNKLFGLQAHLVPPLKLMNDGPKSYHIFKQNGDEYFNIFVNFCQLKPTDQILDIGCGIGRKTLPLLDYVDSKLGRYEGIDVFKPHIDWCKKKIEITYPYFHFQHVDIWNKLYNPSGIIKANQYKFPFDKEFDFVILGSVFTHMFISDMRSYMLEINRILKLGGRGMISYFLLNSESEEMIAEGKSTLQIIYEVEPGCKADNPNRFESAMGHDENIILQLFRDLGIKTKIYYGSWCGREQYLTYQDVICLEKI